MGAYSIVDPTLSERRSNRLRNSNVELGLPYKLKHLIDLVAQRNYLFTYDGIQYGPLLNVEKAEAYVKQAMIGASTEVVGLISLGKMGTSLPYLVGPASRLTRLITDASDENVLNPYRSQGIEVTST
jgi:DeoR/GlpR family transcriptional regulator of sugar metabolism